MQEEFKNNIRAFYTRDDVSQGKGHCNTSQGQDAKEIPCGYTEEPAQEILGRESKEISFLFSIPILLQTSALLGCAPNAF